MQEEDKINTCAPIEANANAKLYARMFVRKDIERSSWPVSKESNGAGGGCGNENETLPLLQQKEYFGSAMLDESTRSASHVLALHWGHVADISPNECLPSAKMLARALAVGRNSEGSILAAYRCW